MENTKNCPICRDRNIWTGFCVQVGQTFTPASTKKSRPFLRFEFQSMTASTCFDDLLAIKLRESIQSVCLNLTRDTFSAVVWWGREAGKTKGNQQKSTHPLSHFCSNPSKKKQWTSNLTQVSWIVMIGVQVSQIVRIVCYIIPCCIQKPRIKSLSSGKVWFNTHDKPL